MGVTRLKKKDKMEEKILNNVKIKFSPQAELIINNLKDFDVEKFLERYKERGVIIGGGDIMDYLEKFGVK